MKSLKTFALALLAATFIFAASADAQVYFGGYPSNPNFNSIKLHGSSTASGTINMTTGCTTNPTSIAYTYYIINRTVHLILGPATCVESGGPTTILFSALPAAIAPASTHQMAVPWEQNSSGPQPGYCTITSGAVLNCGIGTAGLLGTVGFQNKADMVYSLD